jgi:MFS family permease
LVKRFTEAGVIVGGLVVLASAIVLIPLLHHPAATVALMGLLMAGHSLVFPNAGALVSRTAPRDRQGSVMGLNMASNAVSRIVAPPLFGALFSVSADVPFYICAIMVAGAFAVALVMLVRQRQPG